MCELHPIQVSEWEPHLIERAAEVFEGAIRAESVDLDPLHAKIGQLALENDCLARVLTKAGLFSARP